MDHNRNNHGLVRMPGTHMGSGPSGHNLDRREIASDSIYGFLEDSHIVMTEKVQSMAGRIYQEFERMMSRYDEDVVRNLMPLVVNVLENLDSAYQSNRELDVELELLREDSEQLVVQYEREKSNRKMCEQRLLEIEDIYDSEKKELVSKQQSLESIVRMLELKHKNAIEHSSRLEDRETDLKKEYAKLHDRYTELFKTHVDYMERTKFLMKNSQQFNMDKSTDSNNIMLSSTRSVNIGNTNNNNNSNFNMTRSSGPVSFGFSSLEAVSDEADSLPASPLNRSSSTSSTSLNTPASKLDSTVIEKAHVEIDKVQNENKTVSRTSSINDITVDLNSKLVSNTNGLNTSQVTTQTKKEERSGNILYQEFSFQDIEVGPEVEETNEVTGNWVHPGEYASSINDNFFGMGKEVEKLIMENNELLETKNALNVVKDDLIAQVDELQSKMDYMQGEVDTLTETKLNLMERVSKLEEELKRQKEAYDASKEEDDGCLVNKKRFTRVEMARVLMERNQYKEKLIELQEAIRWSEMLRANKYDMFDKQKSKTSIFSMFSKFFSRSSYNNSPVPTTHSHPNLSSVSSSFRFNATNNHVTPEVCGDVIETGSSQFSSRYHRTTKRPDEHKSVQFCDKDDNRFETSGWRFSPKNVKNQKSAVTPIIYQPMVTVPLPVYCQPIHDDNPDMHIWCGAGVNLFGGYTSDGDLKISENSKHGSEILLEPNTEMNIQDNVAVLDNEIIALKKHSNFEMKLSSYVWLCMVSKQLSSVTIINANNPAEVLNKFKICSDHLLCIGSVPGVSPNDYIDESEFDDLPKLPNNPRDYTENQVYVAESVTNYDENSILNGDMITNNVDDSKEKLIKTVLATMWMGSQNHSLFIHSSMDKCEECLASLILPDSIISIVHVSGKVVIALANGTVAIFGRQKDGQWNLSKYYVIVLGPPTKSVRCLTAVGENVWCGYRNRIFVISPKKLKILHYFLADPREEIEVRLMTWYDDGVWIATRLTSVLKLFHAFDYNLMQTFNIEPFVNKMLGPGKFGFSFIRITSLLVSVSRLWIGTCYGVVISIPLSESAVVQQNLTKNHTLALNDIGNSLVCTSKCCTTQTQVSLHGHREDVKFFVTVPGCGGTSAASTPSDSQREPLTPMPKPVKVPPAMLVLCGGKGYIDFRAGDNECQDEMPHLLIWQVATF